MIQKEEIVDVNMAISCIQDIALKLPCARQCELDLSTIPATIRIYGAYNNRKAFYGVGGTMEAAMENYLHNLTRIDEAQEEMAPQTCEEESSNKERNYINMDYRAWLEELFQDYLVTAFHNTAMVWLRNKTWRRYYLQGFEPAQAANELLPF